MGHWDRREACAEKMSDCSVALRAVTPMNSAAATRMRAAGSVLTTQEDELVSLRQRRAAVAEEGAWLDARIAAIELARGAV